MVSDVNLHPYTKVLFVCTANVLDTIPAPLLDRMVGKREGQGYTDQGGRGRYTDCVPFF